MLIFTYNVNPALFFLTLSSYVLRPSPEGSGNIDPAHYTVLLDKDEARLFDSEPVAKQTLELSAVTR